MQLIYRDIATVVNHNIQLILPDYIDTQQVEVIVIPVKKQNKTIDFNAYFGISNLGNDLVINHLQQSRDALDRTIFD
jgi:hypothetical protein